VNATQSGSDAHAGNPMETHVTETFPTPAEVVDAMHAAFRAPDLDGISRHWAEDVYYQAPGVELVGRPARIAAAKVWLDACTENDIQTTGSYVDGDEIVDLAVMTSVHSGPLPLQLQETAAS
jgi:limonene-1,2-epoxide hydrolase